MVSLLIAIAPLLLTILGSIAKASFSEEGKRKREEYERDKELAEQDSIAISKRLSDGFDRLRLHNRKKK